MRKVLLVMACWAVTSTLLASDVETIEAKSFLVSGQFVNVSDTGIELTKPWNIQWHLNPAWFKKEGVRYKAVFEYFIPETLNPSVTALTLGLWRTKPKAENAATGFKLDLTKVKRGEWQTAEMENLPELSGFSGYFYFCANSKDAYDSAEKIKIKSIKLVPKEK